MGSLESSIKDIVRELASIECILWLSQDEQKISCDINSHELVAKGLEWCAAGRILSLCLQVGKTLQSIGDQARP